MLLRALAYGYRLLAGDDPRQAREAVERLEARLEVGSARAESMMRDALQCTRAEDCPCVICREDRS